jgi:hypothetical protein
MFLGSLIRPPALRTLTGRSKTGSGRNSPIAANAIRFASRCAQFLRLQVQMMQSPSAVLAAKSGIADGAEGRAR